MKRHIPDRPVRRRDAALRRLRRAKQTMATGSLLLAGAVATAAAHGFPGHAQRTVTRAIQTEPGAGATSPHPRARVGRTRTRAPSTTSSRSTTVARTSTTVTAPTYVPAPAPPTSAVVVSGAS